MAVTRTTGFSLSEDAIATVKRLAGERGVSASRFVNDLVLREGSRRRAPEVLVDGVRFVPARGKRA